MTIEKMLHTLESHGSELVTPAYIVDEEKLLENIMLYNAAFRNRFKKFIFGYSYKTNHMPAILRTVHEMGGYAEVVSFVELCHARHFVPDHRIIYNGVIPDPYNKYEVASHGGTVNIESLLELEQLNELASKYGEPIEVGIRVNLDIPGIKPSRFGMEITQDTLARIRSMDWIKVIGIHCHVSNGREIRYWKNRAEEMCRIAKVFNAKYIDLGGNMSGPMNPELQSQFPQPVPTFEGYAEAIHEVFAREYGEDMPTLILESGTPIVGNVQSLLTTVLNVKTVQGREEVVVDARGMDVSMVGDCGKRFPLYQVPDRNSNTYMTMHDATVYGCTCVEPDVLYKGLCGLVGVGDRFLMDNVGAYSNVMASRFIQGTPAAYLLKDDKFSLVKHKDSYEDVFATFL